MRGMDFILYVKVMQLQERVNVIELISLYLLIPPYLVVVVIVKIGLKEKSGNGSIHKEDQ